MSNPGTSLLHYPPISSSSLSSALLKCRFYVFSINSSFVSSFDLESHVWSNLQTLKPPGVSFSFLISCKDRLVLAGIGNSQGGSSFNLWRIDEKTIEFSEFAFVPQDLLYSLFDSDEDNKFASLKCVGLGDLIYVFNEDYHKRYPACVLRLLLLLNSLVAASAGGGEYPNCLSPVNKFHQVISLCSTVSLHSILRGRGGDAGAEAYVWGFIISFPLPGNVMQMMDLQDSYAWNRERSCVHKKKIVMLLDQRLYIG